MGDEIIRGLKLRSDDIVLDVAAGTGEPGLSIAEIVKNGKVISTDLAEDMLGVARSNAERRKLLNFETKACDVCELPFADQTFNAISCRFGFMFFPDMVLAAQELFRVLKPGGRIAVSVWSGAEKNRWVSAIMEAISQHITLTPPAEGAPGIFRCANKDMISDLFNQAGFKNITQTSVDSKLKMDSPEVYWSMMTELAAPVMTSLNKTDEETKLKIKNSLFTILSEKNMNGKIELGANAMVIVGEKIG